jgi:pyrophosphatase PpaX
MTAILWDLDDTLLNTLPGRMKALAHAYSVCVGGVTDPVELWRSHRGGTIEALGEKLVGEAYPRFVEVYRDFYFNNDRRIAPYDGIVETLCAFAADEVPMAVVTSKVSWGATEELEDTRLLQYFSAVVGFDDTEAHKPDPEPVHEAMQRLMLTNPREVIFVGDSPADVWAARNAGCAAIAATWGTLDAELLRDAGPDHVATHPAEVATFAAARRAR